MQRDARPHRRPIAWILGACATTAALAAATVVAATPAGADGHDPIAERIRSAARSTTWEPTATIPLDFETHHPQGLARVGDRLFLSSVEIIEPTDRFDEPVDGYDRTPGVGVGHLFVLDLGGNLVEDIVLGEGDIYHPGGIDAAGTSLWVPVAEYRPDSTSIVYRVDAETLEVTEEFRADDHIGGVVPDPATGLVHGVSWGSRRLYTWTSDGVELQRRANSGAFVDHQDCQGVATSMMLCGGVAGIATADGDGTELGGLSLVDLADGTIVHEVPLQMFSSAGHSVARNAVLVEQTDGGLRLWAAPDDGDEAAGTELLVFEAELS